MTEPDLIDAWRAYCRAREARRRETNPALMLPMDAMLDCLRRGLRGAIHAARLSRKEPV